MGGPHERPHGSLHGEIVGASRAARFHAAEKRIGRVTHVLDELVAIPGTSQRFGLDPVIGVVPVIGDSVAAVVGAWVIAEAARFGIPRIVLARMVLNMLVDLAIGSIPLIGVLFDVVLRSNSANLALFQRHALDADATTTGHRAFFLGLLLVIVGAIWLVAFLTIRALEAVAALLG